MTSCSLNHDSSNSQSSHINNPTRKNGYPVSTQSDKFEDLGFYESLRETEEWRNFSYDGYQLPATHEPKETCGKYGWMVCVNPGCRRKHEGKAYCEVYKKSCKSMFCRVCVQHAIDREANACARRVWKYRKLRKRGYPIHVVISPPKWDYGKPVSDFKKYAKNVFPRVGMEGSAFVFHPARFSEEGRPYASPHFHCIGFGWIEGTKEYQKKTGWVVKNLRVRKTQGEVFATMRYLLSHAGIKKRKHVVTWYGKLAYNNKALGKVFDEKCECLCPYCFEPMEKAELNITEWPEQWPLDRGRPPDLEFKGFLEPSLFRLVSYDSSSPRTWDHREGKEGIGSVIYEKR